MQEWSDGVRLAIDVFVACIIISALLICISLGKSIMRVMEAQDAAAADVQAYRVTAAYEGKDVMPQDVVNLVLTNRGYPYVKVTLRNGNVLLWDTATNTQATNYTSAAVGGIIPNERSVYKCNVILTSDITPDAKGLGDPIGFEFVEEWR